MTKEAIRDYRRNVHDRGVNETLHKVVRSGKVENVWNKDILTGDILFIEANETVPADMVIISLSDESLNCFIETALLDGETQPKMIFPISQTSFAKDVKSISELQGTIESEHPNIHLFRYRGKLSTADSTYYLSDKQFLPKGSVLRNAIFIYGAVVYTGAYTKINLNQQRPPFKVSTNERLMNKISLFIISLIASLCLVLSTSNLISQATFIPYHWELKENRSDAESFFTAMASYFLLLSYMLPISLYMNIEMTYLINSFKPVVYPSHQPIQKIVYDSSHLGEELAKVEHIFTDKSGTLTTKGMEFSKSWVCGTVLNEKAMPGSIRNFINEKTENRQTEDANIAKDMLKCMALCHSAAIESNKLDLASYRSQESAEVEILECAKANGARLVKITPTERYVQFTDKQESSRFEILHVLSPKYKPSKTSLIVRDEEGIISLICRGDHKDLLDLQDQDSREIWKDAITNIKDVEMSGLVTCTYGHKIITPSEYKI